VKTEITAMISDLPVTETCDSKNPKLSVPLGSPMTGAYAAVCGKSEYCMQSTHLNGIGSHLNPKDFDPFYLRDEFTDGHRHHSWNSYEDMRFAVLTNAPFFVGARTHQTNAAGELTLTFDPGKPVQNKKIRVFAADEAGDRAEAVVCFPYF
jgi:hypothetical protein